MNLELLDEAELRYRDWYHRLPQVWSEPVQDWNELTARCERAGLHDLPPESLSAMGTVLTEDEFFGDSRREAVCFNNLRYCPPFLHRLEFIKIVYCFRGHVTLYLNNARYELSSGNFCIVTPGIRHTVFSCHDEDIIINLLMRASTFSQAFSGILMERNILSDFFWKILYTPHSNRILLFRCESDEKLDRCIERAFDESNRGDGASGLLMRSCCMIFLGRVMRDHLDALETVEKPTNEVYAMPAILQYIGDHLATVTPEELSVRFHMKEDELRRYLLHESGYTYHTLLRELRMRKAVWLLENTSRSTERIMEDIGYSNLTHFYKTFREYFNATPSEYRKTGGRRFV